MTPSGSDPSGEGPAASTGPHRSRSVVAALVAGLVSALTWRARTRVPGGPARWERTNHRGDTVSLLEGPAWAGGALAGTLTAGVPARYRAGAALALAGGAAFGVVDDLAESGSTKGLRGHLGALSRGEVTTGGLKVVGIGLSGAAAAAVLLGPRRPGTGRLAAAADVLAGAGVIAGAANLANLLDLRPGRVHKVVALTAPALLPDPATGPLAAAALGATAAVTAADLQEHGMLGDGGANAAGALLGATLVARTATAPHGRATRWAALAGLAALTLASERVSFTRVIEATPGLRELDALGRRPRPPA